MTTRTEIAIRWGVFVFEKVLVYCQGAWCGGRTYLDEGECGLEEGREEGGELLQQPAGLYLHLLDHVYTTEHARWK